MTSSLSFFVLILLRPTAGQRLADMNTVSQRLRATNTLSGHSPATPTDESAIRHRGRRRPVALLASNPQPRACAGRNCQGAGANADDVRRRRHRLHGGRRQGVRRTRFSVSATLPTLRATSRSSTPVTGERAGSVTPRMNNFGRKLQSDGAGGLYLYDPFSGDRVTRIRADGTVAFSSSGNGGLLGVTMVRDGNTLYMGGGWNNLYVGSFDLFDQPFVAALDANTLQPIRSWQPRVNGVVRALHVANGVLYMGGAFTGVANGPGQPMVSRAVSRRLTWPVARSRRGIRRPTNA